MNHDLSNGQIVGVLLCSFRIVLSKHKKIYCSSILWQLVNKTIINTFSPVVSHLSIIDLHIYRFLLPFVKGYHYTSALSTLQSMQTKRKCSKKIDRYQIINSFLQMKVLAPVTKFLKMLETIQLIFISFIKLACIIKFLKVPLNKS